MPTMAGTTVITLSPGMPLDRAERIARGLVERGGWPRSPPSRAMPGSTSASSASRAGWQPILAYPCSAASVRRMGSLTSP